MAPKQNQDKKPTPSNNKPGQKQAPSRPKK